MINISSNNNRGLYNFLNIINPVEYLNKNSFCLCVVGKTPSHVFLSDCTYQYARFRIYSMIIMKDGIGFIQYVYKSKVY